MPWKEVTKMSSKLEFVRFVLEKRHSFSELCHRFKISRKTGYKLLKRFQEEGEAGLQERSRRPQESPKKTGAELEEKIVSLRKAKPVWGGRKIRALLLEQNETAVPAISTITDILHRHHLIPKDDFKKLLRPHRFEHESPNDLWQADFKGHVAMLKGRCHPLTILDDHSRYSIGLRACDNEKGGTIKSHFTALFKEHGLPWRINFDNGAPWGSSHQQRHCRYTEFSLWLVRLGIRVGFSRPKHPQTNGKIERFHRTLKAELLKYYTFKNSKEAQRYFDAWRIEYNTERPHESLGMKTPLSRYQMSPREFPLVMPSIEYRPGDQVRKISSAGILHYQGRHFFVSESLRGLPVALREYEEDKYHIYFCQQKLFGIDLKKD